MLEPAQARIVITRAWRQQLRNLTPEDVRKEGFTSFTEFRPSLERKIWYVELGPNRHGLRVPPTHTKTETLLRKK
jgi:hypothetical protein